MRPESRRKLAPALFFLAVAFLLAALLWGAHVRGSERHLTAALYNVDDEEVLLVDGEPRLRVGFGGEETLDLGWLSNDTVIEVRAFNEGGTYLRGFRIGEDGEPIAEEASGIPDLAGADGNASAKNSERTLVYRFRMHADGTHRSSSLTAELDGPDPKEADKPTLPDPVGFKDLVVDDSSVVWLAGLLATVLIIGGLQILSFWTGIEVRRLWGGVIAIPALSAIVYFLGRVVLDVF